MNDTTLTRHTTLTRLKTIKTALEVKQSEIKVKEEISKQNARERYILTKEIELLTDTQTIMMDELASLNKYNKVMNKYRADKRDEARNILCSLMDTWMSEIFPEEGYQFRIKTTHRGKYTYSELINTTLSSGNTERVPKLSSGMGARQCISLFATAILLMLSQSSPVLVLDEVMSNLCATKGPSMSEILNVLEEMGFQLIIVEHRDDVFSKVKYNNIELEKINDETRVLSIEEIDNTLNISTSENEQ